MGISVFQSIKYLRTFDPSNDILAKEAAFMGIFFGFLGLFTGSVWSRVTWGEAIPASDPTAWWAWDPKQTLALVAIMVYLAYFLLRSSFENHKDAAKISAIYNIFAAVSLIPLTLIIPKMIGGLHPGGSEGSPVFNTKDISNSFRIVFYPSIIGFICLGTWLTDLRYRIAILHLKFNENK
jgi:heme exporter protein C